MFQLFQNLQSQFIKLMVFFHLSLFISIPSVAREHISRQRIHSDTLLVSLQFSEPALQGFMVPITCEKIFFRTESDPLTILENNRHVRIKNYPVPVVQVEDFPIGIETDQSFIKSAKKIPDMGWKLHPLGNVETKEYFRLDVFPNGPISIDNRQSWIQNLSFKIIGKAVSFISRLPDSYYIKKFPASAPPINSVQSTFSQGENQRLKIMISKEGIYRLPFTLIRKAGWDLSQINPQYLRLVGRDGEIPIRIIGAGDGQFDLSDEIEFWGDPLWERLPSGEKRLDVFAVYNVYWLEIGDDPGLRLGQEEALESSGNGMPILYPWSTPFTMHEEKHAYFHRLAYSTDVTDGDYWFYASPIPGGEKRSYPFELLSPYESATQWAVLKIDLRGQSTSSKSHELDVYINDHWIASTHWEGNSSLLFSSEEFSPSFLLPGENNLTIVNRSTEGPFNQLVLDWFELTYPRRLETEGDCIRFRAPVQSSNSICDFEISGFSRASIELYKIGASRIYRPEIYPVTDSLGLTRYTLHFQDIIINESAEYIALTQSQKLLPDTVALIYESDLLSPGKGADYIIITPSDSLGETICADLINLRESQGMQAEVVLLQDIYNSFHDGIPNPEGIRKFLQYTYLHWTPSPRYVLLIGDGVINQQSPVRTGNLMPVPLYQTWKYGAAPSDHRYTLLTGDDDFPEIAIGRLPVRSKKELRAIVDKIVINETQSSGSWKNSYLLIGSGGHGDVFPQQSEDLIRNELNPAAHPERLYLSGPISDPYVGGTEDLLRHFRDGLAWVNFRGHGGGAIWSDAGLLDLDDVPLIENKGKLPFATSMTCFTSDFSSGRQSIGEAMLCQEETGVAAFWGSTGLGWLWNDYYLLREWIRALEADPNLTVGELIRQAKTSYLMAYPGELSLSELHQYTLLGDPAMRLAFPKDTMILKLQERSIFDPGGLTVSGESSVSSYDIQLEVVEDDLSECSRETFNFPQPQWQASISIPPGFKDIDGGVRVYAWNAETGYEARGFASFSYFSTFFDSLVTEPGQPTSRDSIYFSVVAEDPAGLKDLHCVIITPYQDSLPMIPGNTSAQYRTTQAVGPFSPGTWLSYAFLAQNSNDSLYMSDTVQVAIPTLPDLRVLEVSLTGSKEVLLTAEITNNGQESVEDVPVHLTCPAIGYISEKIVSIAGYESATLFTPFPSPTGELEITIHIDPDSTIQEFRKTNNVHHSILTMNRFLVTPQSGTVNGTSGPDTVGIFPHILCYIPVQAVQDSTVLILNRIISGSENLPFSDVFSASDIVKVEISGFNQNVTLQKEMTLQLFASSNDSMPALKPYRWENAIQRWAAMPFLVSDTIFIFQSGMGGYFQLQTSEDHEPPWIEIQVENQPFAQGSFVSKTPHIQILLQDASGVDLRPEQFQVYLDQQLLDPSTLIFPDSTLDPTQTVLSLQPQLESGEHSISVTAKDIHGNFRTMDNVQFQIGSDLNIQYLGNYPNPFRVRTVFAYVLTDAAQRLTLKIYTVSGKLIRTFDDYDYSSADYHEIDWDGRDEWGNLVANGVYFFRIKADKDDLSREVTGKIAKLR